MWYALVVYVVCVAGACAAPHIVVVIADDMGWNDVGFHGSNQILTPNIDALAYQGVILNRHYTLPSCSPSRAAFLTGRYAARTGMQTPIAAGTTSALSLNYTLLPQHLRRLGYQSHLVGKWHLGSHRSEYLPTRRGFHSHFGFWNGYSSYYTGIHHSRNVSGIDARRGEAGAWQEFVGHYLTDVLTKEAVSVVRAHNNSEGPLYLQVALSAPHTGMKGEELQVRDLAANEKQYAYIADEHRRLYAGMVQGVDDAVGAIVESLRSRQMLNDSIILFTSDNGAPTLDPLYATNNYGSNWPLRGMKLSCHEGGVRSAAALWSPLVAGGQVFEQLIHISDWLPTFYSAAGGDVKDLGPLDGVNQWTSLRTGQARDDRKEMLVDLDPRTGNEALIKWPWKLIRYSSNKSAYNTYSGEDGRGPEVPEYAVEQVTGSLAALALFFSRSDTELLALRARATIDDRCDQVIKNDTSARQCDQTYCLFNLLADPCETSDLSTDNLPIVADLKQALDNYRRIAVPSTAQQTDPRAHPSRWSNYWAPWADEVASGAEARVTLSALLGAFLLLAMLWSL